MFQNLIFTYTFPLNILIFTILVIVIYLLLKKKHKNNMGTQKPSVNWPRRTAPLVGTEDLLKQNPISDSSPQEERVTVNLVKNFVINRISSEVGIADLNDISTPSGSNLNLQWNGSNFVWAAAVTDTDLFSVNKTASANRTHQLGTYFLRLNSSTGGALGAGDFTVSDDGSGFEFDQGDAEFKIGNSNLSFYNNATFGSLEASINVNSNNLVLSSNLGNVHLSPEASSGVRFLQGYGGGTKQETDLSKTESTYAAIFATDGTILEKPISEIAGGGGGTIYEYTAGANTTLWVTETGATASLAGGVLTITIPSGAFLIRGVVEYTAAEATYATGVVGGYRVRVVHSDGTTLYSSTPSVMGRTAGGAISDANPLVVNSGAINDYRIDERSGGAIAWVFQQLNTRTPNGGVIHF